jgi:hypothetical protein
MFLLLARLTKSVVRTLPGTYDYCSLPTNARGMTPIINFSNGYDWCTICHCGRFHRLGSNLEYYDHIDTNSKEFNELLKNGKPESKILYLTTKSYSRMAENYSYGRRNDKLYPIGYYYIYRIITYKIAGITTNYYVGCKIPGGDIIVLPVSLYTAKKTGKSTFSNFGTFMSLEGAVIITNNELCNSALMHTQSLIILPTEHTKRIKNKLRMIIPKSTGKNYVVYVDAKQMPDTKAKIELIKNHILPKPPSSKDTHNVEEMALTLEASLSSGKSPIVALSDMRKKKPPLKHKKPHADTVAFLTKNYSFKGLRKVMKQCNTN